MLDAKQSEKIWRDYANGRRIVALAAEHSVSEGDIRSAIERYDREVFEAPSMRKTIARLQYGGVKIAESLLTDFEIEEDRAVRTTIAKAYNDTCLTVRGLLGAGSGQANVFTVINQNGGDPSVSNTDEDLRVMNEFATRAGIKLPVN